MSFFAFIFLSFLTNQTEKNETLKTPFENFKMLILSHIESYEFFMSLFGFCFQKLFFVLENKRHSKTRLAIVSCVFKFVLHVFNLVVLENNLKLFFVFSTLWTEENKSTKKSWRTKKKHSRRTKRPFINNKSQTLKKCILQ